MEKHLIKILVSVALLFGTLTYFFGFIIVGAIIFYTAVVALVISFIVGFWQVISELFEDGIR